MTLLSRLRMLAGAWCVAVTVASAQTRIPPSRPVLPPTHNHAAENQASRSGSEPVLESHHSHRNSEAAGFSEVQPESAPSAPGHRFVEPPAVPAEPQSGWKSHEVDAERRTLQSLLDLAQASNPTLLQARLHINSQLGKAVQAGLYPNPTVAAVGEQIGLDGTAGEWVGAEVEQRFVTGGKLRLSRKKYLQRARVAEFLAMSQQFRVSNDIRIHFYRLLAAQEILKLQGELLKTAEDSFLTAREMYNLGQTNQSDMHRATAILQKHRLAVLQARNQVQMHSFDLAAMAGLETGVLNVDGQLVSDREAIELESAWQQLLHGSPELLAANAKLREDCITLSRERVEWIPDVLVSAGPGYNNVDRQTTVAARIAIEVPLFDRNQGTIDQAMADYNRQVREIQRLKLELRHRLSAEYSKYLTALQHQTEYSGVILPAKKEAYRLSLQSYKRARSEWPDVLQAQEDYTNARMMLVQNQMQQRISEALLDGFLLSGGLQTPGGPLPAGHIDSVPKPR